MVHEGTMYFRDPLRQSLLAISLLRGGKRFSVWAGSGKVQIKAMGLTWYCLGRGFGLRFRVRGLGLTNLVTGPGLCGLFRGCVLFHGIILHLKARNVLGSLSCRVQRSEIKEA